MKRKTTNRTLGALALPTLLLAACGDDTPEAKGSIVAVAEANGFSTLVSAIDAAGLKATLEGAGPFTVFAPTNAAFEALPAGALDALLADVPQLQEVLKYHVVSGRVTAEQVVTLSEATTLQGQKVTIRVQAGTVFINDAKVTVTDVEADNGIIHVIDAVLLPSEEPPPEKNIVEIAAGNPDFTTLVAALEAAGLDSALAGAGPFTVFAPTNAAFDALPEGTIEALLADIPALTRVLQYHVVSGRLDAATLAGRTSVTTLAGISLSVSASGGVVSVGGVPVAAADISASNGIIHVIGSVLIPPEEETPKNIVEIAAGNPDFSTLVAAVTAAGLDDDLAGAGPFTVFAPTNAAFAALPAGTVEALLADIPALTKILLYHVVAGDLEASAVVTRASLTSLLGPEIPVEVEGSTVRVAGATITATDIQASNGVIHVIDAVIQPPTIVDLAVANGNFDTLVAALGAANLVDTLAGPGPFTVFAPTDAAFDALPAGTVEALLADIPELTKILTYHVVSGSLLAADVVAESSLTSLAGPELPISVEGNAVRIAGALITITDIKAANGVIHVIDAVMLPPSIVDLAVATPDLSTLVTALGLTTTPDLVEALSGPGPFTVFAPVNSAFDAIPEATLNAILADEPQLNSILRYHVVAGELLAADVVAASSLTSLEGSSIPVAVNGNTVTVDGATVIATDIRAKNGVIHLIDAVILP